LAIAFDHGAMGNGAIPQREAIDQASHLLAGLQPLQGPGQRFDVGHVQAAIVDTARTAHDDADSACGAEHSRIHLLAPLGLHLLGVVQAGEGTAIGTAERLVVDQHRGGNQRPRKTAPPSLVGTGNLVAAEAAIEGEESA
jgi:hypothetical protein